MKFSIIIPAYNSEKFIARCLESVVTQKFPADEFEIIVVDDCSPDRQNDIIKIFISFHKNNNINLIKHVRNLRQGGARNTAMKEAKGEYIFFLDSDDYWVRTDVLKTFDSILKNNDCEIIESKNYLTSAFELDKNIETNMKCNILCPEEYYTSPHHPCIWASAYKKTYIENIKFRENVAYEDCDWKIVVYANATKIGIINFPFYFYTLNLESTTHKLVPKTFRDLVCSQQYCRRAYDQSLLSDTLKTRLTKDGHIVKSLLSLRNYSYKDGQKLLNELKIADYLESVKSYCNTIELLQIRTAIKFPNTFLAFLHGLVKFKRYCRKFGNCNSIYYDGV